MGTTATFNLPYPEASDQPLVHLDIKALADSVDVVEAAGRTAVAKGVVSRARRGGTTAGFTTTETVVLQGPTFTFSAARVYKVTVGSGLSSTAAGDLITVQVRDSTVSGTVRATGRHYVPAVGGPGQNTPAIVEYVEGWSGAVVPTVTAVRSAGSGTLTALTGMHLIVEDIGPA